MPYSSCPSGKSWRCLLCACIHVHMHALLTTSTRKILEVSFCACIQRHMCALLTTSTKKIMEVSFLCMYSCAYVCLTHHIHQEDHGGVFLVYVFICICVPCSPHPPRRSWRCLSCTYIHMSMCSLLTTSTRKILEVSFLSYQCLWFSHCRSSSMGGWAPYFSLAGMLRSSTKTTDFLFIGGPYTPLRRLRNKTFTLLQTLCKQNVHRQMWKEQQAAAEDILPRNKLQLSSTEQYTHF